MPKTTHQHQKDAMSTDKKFRPEDEKLYALEKQEFQESEKAEKAEGAEIAEREQEKSSKNPDETGEK